jgi:hypothetical protein
MVWHWPPAIAQVRAKLVIVLFLCTLAFVAIMGKTYHMDSTYGLQKKGGIDRFPHRALFVWLQLIYRSGRLMLWRLGRSDARDEFFCKLK